MPLLSSKTGLSSKEECTSCPKGNFCSVAGVSEPSGKCDPGFICYGGAQIPNPVDGVTGGPPKIVEYVTVNLKNSLVAFPDGSNEQQTKIALHLQVYKKCIIASTFSKVSYRGFMLSQRDAWQLLVSRLLATADSGMLR